MRARRESNAGCGRDLGGPYFSLIIRRRMYMYMSVYHFKMALPEVPFSVLTLGKKTTKQTMMKVEDGRTQNMFRSIDIFQQGPQGLSYASSAVES